MCKHACSGWRIDSISELNEKFIRCVRGQLWHPRKHQHWKVTSTQTQSNHTHTHIHCSSTRVKRVIIQHLPAYFGFRFPYMSLRRWSITSTFTLCHNWKVIIQNKQQQQYNWVNGKLALQRRVTKAHLVWVVSKNLCICATPKYVRIATKI